MILGNTGRNFAAGMSGGIAYIYDPDNVFPAKCNMGMVGLDRVTDPAEVETLAGYVRAHLEHTGSTVAKELLGDWVGAISKFVKVMPHDYKRALETAAKEEANAEDIAA